MTSNDKEVWHFPRRADLEEFADTIDILRRDEFKNKRWTPNKQERLASLLDQENITKDHYGRISPSSVRTLIAAIKYFGLLEKRDGALHITKAGNEFTDEDQRRNVFEKQLIKLQVTNPKIQQYCKNIRVFPYRVILHCLLKLGYITFNEMGFHVLKYKGEIGLNELVNRIEEFRKLPSQRKEEIIGEYKKTKIGNKSLSGSTMTNYVMKFASETGTCYREKEKGVKKLKLQRSESYVKNLLKEYEFSTFEFTDRRVFNIYMGDPSITKTPSFFEINIKDKEGNPAYECVLEIEREFNNALKLIEENGKTNVKLFPERNYNYCVYDSEGELQEKDVINPLFDDVIELTFESDSTIPTQDELVTYVEDLLSNDYDSRLDDRLKVLRKINNYRVGSIKRVRGGRLEQLFYFIFLNFKENGMVDDVVWHGNSDNYKIPSPAPGGVPDLIFFINDYVHVLELTLIGDKRSQWSKEGASVPDHILEVQENYPESRVIGHFIAPVMHKANKEGLLGLGEHRGFTICFHQILDLVSNLDKINSREELKKIFIPDDEE